MWNRCSGRAGLSWGSSCALKGMGILGEREHDHRAGEGGVGHLAEKGGLRRADGVPGRLILFLLGSSSGDVQRPSLANRAQPSPCGQPAGQIPSEQERRWVCGAPWAEGPSTVI